VCCCSSQVEQCGLKLAHQFPWAASAYVAVGLALRRRELSYPDMPSSAPKRKQIMKVRLRGHIAVCVSIDWECWPHCPLCEHRKINITVVRF